MDDHYRTSTSRRSESRTANLPRTLINRQLSIPSFESSRRFSYDLKRYMLSRLAIRAKISLSSEGCTFAIKFAPESNPFPASRQPSSVNDHQYCLIAYGPKLEVWETSGIYAARNPKNVNGGRLLHQFQHHTDVVSICTWLPNQYCESFEAVTSPPEPTPLEDNPFSIPRSAPRESTIESLCMPPFFSASFDQTINFYRGFNCVKTMDDHKDWVRFMSVNAEGKRMLSGCVNSNIFGWDVENLIPVFKIVPAHIAPLSTRHSLKGINSINGLEWTKSSQTVFASGAGDGSVKLWDSRLLGLSSNADDSIATINAHDGKLNNIQWTQDDRYLLSSGRDDTIRLMDMRMLRDVIYGLSSPGTQVKDSVTSREKLVIREYKGHSCLGYNVQASFWENDERIVTGSRDGKIYIYETSTGDILKTLTGPVQPTHLTVPLPEKCGHGFMAALASNANIYVWGASSIAENEEDAKKLIPEIEIDDEDHAIEMARQEALERTISQFGEQMLNALRRSGSNTNIILVNEEIRNVYIQHITEALVRLGRGYLLQPPVQRQEHQDDEMHDDDDDNDDDDEEFNTDIDEDQMESGDELEEVD